MSTANTGIKRATKLIIHRLNDGIELPGYPLIYDMRNSIPGLLSATTDDLKQMSNEDYAIRRNAFIDYVNEQIGYLASNESSTLTDLDMCPL